jgi:5'-nucleotidase
MRVDLSQKLVVGISSRALFDLEDSNLIYEQQGIEAYHRFQIENENVVLPMGVAYDLVEKLLLLKHPTSEESLVEVILLSRNSSDTGLRVFNSIQHYNLNITRAAFTNGESPYHYIGAFGAHLFLSANPMDVAGALSAQCAAATILPSQKSSACSKQLRIAFDGDAVLFSDEAEQVFQKEGLEAFKEHEGESAKIPLQGGPFKGFLVALHQLQTLFPVNECPIRTALVTARDAPAHERVIRTLRAWNIRIDEALFLGGMEKGKFLKAFGADIFFDDQKKHCDSTRVHVTTGHVPHGVTNIG